MPHYCWLNTALNDIGVSHTASFLNKIKTLPKRLSNELERQAHYSIPTQTHAVMHAHAHSQSKDKLFSMLD